MEETLLGMKAALISSNITFSRWWMIKKTAGLSQRLATISRLRTYGLGLVIILGVLVVSFRFFCSLPFSFLWSVRKSKHHSVKSVCWDVEFVSTSSNLARVCKIIPSPLIEKKKLNWTWDISKEEENRKRKGL